MSSWRTDTFCMVLFAPPVSVQVFTVLVCMAIIISKTQINWGDAFDGFVPSKTVFQSGGLYTCQFAIFFHFSLSQAP